MQESAIESEENDQNYFVGDEVTYLKDSAKEPSINTLIQQDLLQFQHPVPTLGSAFISPSHTDSPITDKISFSQNPVLNTAAYNETNDSCSNYDLGKYSPEILPNPRRCRRRTKKPKFNQMALENESLQQLQLQPKKIDCHPSSETAPKDLVLDSEGSVSQTDNNSTPQPENINQRPFTPIPISIITVNAARSSSFDMVVDELILDLSMKENIIQDNINDNHQHLPKCEGKLSIPPVSSTFCTPSSLVSLSLAAISKESISLLAHSSNGLSAMAGEESCSIPSTSSADSLSPRPSFHFDDPWDGDFSPDDGDTDYQYSYTSN